MAEDLINDGINNYSIIFLISFVDANVIGSIPIDY
jgi:hypothetical protein